MRTHTSAILIAIIFGLTAWGASEISAQESFEETADFAEYVMFGYPRLEGTNLYDMQASRIQPENWTRRRGVMQRRFVDPYYVQRSIETANRQFGFIASPGVTVIRGPLRFRIIGTMDAFSFMPADGVDEISLDRDDNESSFRSVDSGRISAVHTLRNNWGVSGRIGYEDLFGVRFDFERADFEHGNVSGTNDTARISETSSVTRRRNFLELELGLRSMFAGEPSFLPSTLQLAVVNEDNLMPEGYTFLLGYDNERLRVSLGGGYGQFRNVLFGNARLEVRPLAMAGELKVEHRLNEDTGTGVETTESRMGIDWMSYLVALLDDDIELWGTGASFLGLEYASAPSDIAERIDRSEPPPWSLVMRVAASPSLIGGGEDNWLFYVENNLSGWARSFADAENTGWIFRAGIYLPSFRSFL